MKKLLALSIFFAGFLFSLGAEEISQKEDLDNVYSLDWTLDTATGNAEIRIYALNSDAYDEAFGESNIEEKLNDIISEYGYSQSTVLSTEKDDNYNGQYTRVVRKFKLQ